MRTVQATDKAVSIWFSQEDAPSRCQVLLLVRSALKDMGLDPWPGTEAECFAAGEDTLVIARPAASDLGFYFEDLESLLCCVRICPEGESSLYAVDDGYILTITADKVVSALYEFGVPQPVSSNWAVRAAEHGQCLLTQNALTYLRRCFSP